LNGAQVIVRTLLDEGADTVFGYPGGSALALYDALYEARGALRHVLTCHEQGAAHAADGYARASGRAGVVVATSGPGATNLVTGIAAAYMDSTPMVAVTCNVPLAFLGRDSFQEIDIAGVTMPVTKYGFIVKEPGQLAGTLRDAFAIARSGRPGPVLVDVPSDIAETEVLPGAPDGDSAPYAPPRPALQADAAARFARALASAERPVILCGGGVVSDGAEAGAALRALAERLGAPVCATLMGLGAVPWDHPLFLGMAGLHGLPEANRAIRSCDLLLAVGTRFTERVAGGRDGFAPEADIYHIDIDAAEIGKNVTPRDALVGRAGPALAAILACLGEASVGSAWAAGVQRFSKFSEAFCVDGPRALIRAIWRHRTPDMTVAADVGQHQMWTAQAYGFDRPRGFIASGGLGAMGFGLGAAIGAALARPGARVALVMGDGGFHMSMAELATAVSLRLPLTVFVLDNRGLGLVRQLQDRQRAGRRYAVEPGWRTDYVGVAEALGARGMALRSMAEADEVIGAALASDGPCVVWCPVDKTFEA
jgi:acetolactate synthase-1/2/3 large subunit